MSQREKSVTIGNLAKYDVGDFRIALQELMPSGIHIRFGPASETYELATPQFRSVIVIADGGGRRTVPKLVQAEAKTFYMGWMACRSSV